MQARRASRELALILFSQLDKNLDKYKKEDFSSIVLKSVRTLVSSSYDEVSLCASQLNDIKNQIIEYENNHEDNLSRPIDIIKPRRRSRLHYGNLFYISKPQRRNWQND